MDGIEGLLSLPRHSVDMLFDRSALRHDPELLGCASAAPDALWEAVRWAVKPNGAALFFAQCPYDKVLGASNLAMLRYEWIWYKERGTGFLNANRAPLKKSENILVFYQEVPGLLPAVYLWGAVQQGTRPQRHQSPTTASLSGRGSVIQRRAALSGKCAVCADGGASNSPHTKACGAVRISHQDLHPRPARWWRDHLRWLRDNRRGRPQHGPPLRLL